MGLAAQKSKVLTGTCSKGSIATLSKLKDLGHASFSGSGLKFNGPGAVSTSLAEGTTLLLFEKEQHHVIMFV